MTTSPTPQFEIPNEMRAVAERNVEQAKLAFNNSMQAGQEAVSALEKRVEASQGGALDISKKAMSLSKISCQPSHLPRELFRPRTSRKLSGCKACSFNRRCKS